MNNEKIKTMLISDIEFLYNGKKAAFCPIGTYVVGYANDAHTFKTIDEAISAKVFDGKSLVDIWNTVLPQIS